jgi:hypothetical protein
VNSRPYWSPDEEVALVLLTSTLIEYGVNRMAKGEYLTSLQSIQLFLLLYLFYRELLLILFLYKLVSQGGGESSTRSLKKSLSSSTEAFSLIEERT